MNNNNKNTFHVADVCSERDHRRRQNIVKTSVTHLPNGSSATFLLLPRLDVISDQTHDKMESICEMEYVDDASKFRG